MMFSSTPTVLQAVAGAVAGLDEHPGDRAGAVRAFQDAHLVVGQFQHGQFRVEPLERRRSALSSALTGPLPSPVATIRSPLAFSLTVASLITAPPARRSTMTRQDSTWKCRSRSPASSSRSSSSNEASAASNV